MFEEFKKFAMRGNVLDLAVGVIIGASFTGIVTSLVNDVIMPPVGLVLGGVDFANFFVVLKGAPAETPGRRQGRQGRDPQLRPVHQCDHQLHHRRLCAVSDGSA